MRDALDEAGLAPGQVRALGIAGQLDGCVPTDASGAPDGPCLIWSDRRATEQAASVDPAEIHRRCGLVADASHMAAKIAWLKNHGCASARFHQPTSFLVARLTGEHVFDHGLASTTMLYDLDRRDFAADLLDSFGVDRGSLPRVAAATEQAGRLHARGSALIGLPPGTPVAVGTGDDYSTPLGAGLLGPGAVACVLGTAEVVGALSPVPTRDTASPLPLVETHAYVNDHYFVENPGWLAGGAIEWLSRTMRVADPSELDRLASIAPPGCDGVTFIPALSGAMAPEWNAAARGCFYGLSASHGLEHLARALLEGCAFAMRDVVDRLAALDIATDSLLVLGGGANSPVWPQIRADLVGRPARVPEDVDTSPIGAAMLAAACLDGGPTLGELASTVSQTGRVVEPDGTRAAAYEDAYQRYRTLYAALAPMR